MPPNVKITKEKIVNCAVDIVRAGGEAALNARTVAEALKCSTQPLFSNFATMEELRLAVLRRADELCSEYMEREQQSGEYPTYKANGMAYIRFAKEEKELFKLLYMRDRTFEIIPEKTDTDDRIESIAHESTGLAGTDLKLFHLEMWACVHGIAAMMATGFLDLDWELVSKILTDTYQGLKNRFEKE